MEPEFVTRTKLLLAGVEQCGQSVADVDIAGLWRICDGLQESIPGRVEGSWYELHVGVELGSGIYTVLAGCEVDAPGELPVQACLRVVPAGRYAHFVHRMADGGFGEAFAQVDAWVKASGTAVSNFGLQHYGPGFDPTDGNSILHIYIPLA